MLKKIIDYILIFMLLIWGYLIISDYIRVKNDKEAKYCIDKKIYEYYDGTVEKCMGVLYTVYYYDRDSINIKKEFGPFWKEMHE